jgi:hypothetical protein
MSVTSIEKTSDKTQVKVFPTEIQILEKSMEKNLSKENITIITNFNSENFQYNLNNKKNRKIKIKYKKRIENKINSKYKYLKIIFFSMIIFSLILLLFFLYK